MNGVSAVRLYALVSVIAILAGGWMLYEPLEGESHPESSDELEPQIETIPEGDDSSDSAPESAEGSPESLELDEDDDGFGEILPTSLVAGGTVALGSLVFGSVFFEVIRVTVLLALASPLLSRMKSNREDMLSRGRILGYLEANAGIHFSALRDALGLANGVTAYHLQTLEGQGKVVSWRDGKLRRYAVSGLEKEFLSRIQNPIVGTRLAILEAIAASGQLGLQGTEIRKKLQISRQLLSHHLNELRTSDFIEQTNESRRPNWRLSTAGLIALTSSQEVA